MSKTQQNKQTKEKQPDLKMDRGTEQTLFQRRHTDGQRAYENVLIITNQQGNAEYSVYCRTNDFPIKGNVCNPFGCVSNKPKIKRHFETVGEF